MSKGIRYLANQLSSEVARPGHQRPGSVPGGHQRHVGLMPVAGGVPWEGETFPCTATTSAGTPCKVEADSTGVCHIHARQAAITKEA